MKPAKEHDPRRLDLRRFAAEGAVLHGQWPVAGFERLAEDVAAEPSAAAGGAPAVQGDAGGGADLPPVEWSLQGEQRAVAGAEPEIWLTLRATARVRLTCQRCLQPLVQALEVDRRVRFVSDEAQAERLDEESEDDVLALPRVLDAHELLEDELILALPLVPRHERCPEPLLLPAEPEPEPAPSPFAALAALKRGGNGRGG